MGSVSSETETVVKRIIPYLQRRGYDLEQDLCFEASVQTSERYAKGYVDILVTCGKAKPLFLIEAKRMAKRLSAKDRDQAISYGRAINVPFVVVTNGAEIQCFNTKNKQPITWDGGLTARIPRRDQVAKVVSALRADPDKCDIRLLGDPSLPFRPGLPLKQLNALFARCHSVIRKIEKDEEHAFADFSKLIFLKLLEEKADLEAGFTLPYSYRFHELAAKPAAEADQVRDAVLTMIDQIRKKTPFGEVLDAPVYLKKASTFRRLVGELAAVSFWDCSLDSKGAAFEYFVRATLKGKKLGQYFTPRPLVELMSVLVGRGKIVSALLSGSPERVVDPACGTGGFLVYLMQQALDDLAQRLVARKISKPTYDKAVAAIKGHTFYGADANDGVACAAKMNMIIAGDGHSNITAEDSLAASASTWSIDGADAGLIMTNPPFGTSETDSLSKADLAEYPVSSSKGQHLFLQKMIGATRRGGEICTVIDEGVLNTESATELRQHILRECSVRAVIRTPPETFKPNKINVRASVLYLVRRDQPTDEPPADEIISFVDILSLGYEGSGDTVRGFSLQQLLHEAETIMLTPTAQERAGYQWRAFDIPASAVVADQTARLDFKYWQPETRRRIDELRAEGAPTIGELNLIATARGRSPSADSYVDERDGYALVVKAGSSISRFGELVWGGDFVEKAHYDEIREAAEKDGENRGLVAKGDVLLASTGDGTLGKCCVYDSERPAVADGHVTIIRVDSGVVSATYLSDYLRCGFGAAQIERLFTGSTGLTELTPSQVETIVVDLHEGLENQRRLSEALRVREGQFLRTVKEAESALDSARQAFTSGLVDVAPGVAD